MQVGAVLHSVERFDRAAVHGFRQRQAGQMQFAVDQHAAGAAAALAAAEFRGHVADQFAERDQEIDAAVDEQRDVAAIVTKLEGGLGHDVYSRPDSRRRRWTPTISRRYQALPSALSAGDMPSVAAAAAALIAASSSERPSRARSAALARICVAAIEPSAMRAPDMRPPLTGRCAASVITEPPFGLMRAILR